MSRSSFLASCSSRASSAALVGFENPSSFSALRAYVLAFVRMGFATHRGDALAYLSRLETQFRVLFGLLELAAL